MKKLLLSILLLLSVSMFGQTSIVGLKEAYNEYIRYCDQQWDTIVTNGSYFKTEEMPIYGDCGGKREIYAYKRVIVDTVWDKVQVLFYRHDYANKNKFYWMTADSCYVTSIMSKYYHINKILYDDTDKCTPPTRKVKAVVKQEKPSEEGFFHWLYNQISKP